MSLRKTLQPVERKDLNLTGWVTYKTSQVQMKKVEIQHFLVKIKTLSLKCSESFTKCRRLRDGVSSGTMV